MMKHVKLGLLLLCILTLTLTLTDVHAQALKKVTYGKSTFTLYRPLDLEPTPTCGFVPAVPGYTLKSKFYGPGTYYCYAPGNVPKTNYRCILTEIRDWVFYKPDDVKKFAAERGLQLMDPKDIKKMSGNTRLPNGGLMYRLSENTWIWFYVYGLQNCGPRPWSSNEEHVCGVSFIERVPQETDVVLDRLYRFWNDGVRFAEYAGVTQSNFKTKPSAPSDKNPNYFTIGEVLNPKKGFYTLSFEGGNGPTYLWHSYEKVVAENLKKPDFDATGQIGYNDLYSAFLYYLDVVKVKNNLYFMYTVNSRFLGDIISGSTWPQVMKMEEETAKQWKRDRERIEKENAAALEKLYQEIFK